MAKFPFGETPTAEFRHDRSKRRFEAGTPYASDGDRNRALARCRNEAEREARHFEEVGQALALGVKLLVRRAPEFNRWPQIWREELADELADLILRKVVRWLAGKESE
jgi:hypothetical protein